MAIRVATCAPRPELYARGLLIKNGLWPDIHMTPEVGVRAYLDVQGGRVHGALLPIHWARSIWRRRRASGADEGRGGGGRPGGGVSAAG